MPRPQKCRRVCNSPEYERFSPDGIASQDIVNLSVDEYEAIRLVDLEKHTHEQAAKQMDISRTTVTEIYESARTKIADSIINGKHLIISGGNYKLCDKSHRESCNKKCSLGYDSNLIAKEKGTKIMKIAVTFENGEIFQHFGHTASFKIYDVEEKQIVSSEVVSTNGSGHGALAGMLKALNVDVLICGGIGGGAQVALSEANIKIYGGVAGEADKAVEAFLCDNLNYNPNVKCNHHNHSHGEGHTCGSHGCGSHSCH